MDLSRVFKIATLSGLLCLAAGFPARAQTLSLTASPTALTFTWQIGSALPTAQKVAIRATSGTPIYSLSISGSNALWVSANPDNGRLPANLSVVVNPTSLSVGTYTASIDVSTIPSANISIPVTLVVSQPLPALQLSGTSLTFTVPPNTPTTQMITLSTTGGPIPFTAAATGAAWIQLNPSSGVVLPGAQIVLSVTVDPSTLSPQSTPYNAKVTIVATGVPPANKSQNVTVSLTVNPSTPTITSLWPSAVQAGSPPATVTIRGTNFYKATTVKVAGTTGAAVSITPTVLSSTTLLAVLPATLLANADTLSVTASNPAPGGNSSASSFTVSGSPVVQAVVNVASYQGAAVSPGELITLFGANIGPATPAGMMDADSNGFVDTSIGGVSVTIDSFPAPLLYVSQNQISAQVPYEATVGANKAVVITNGVSTANGTVTIAAQSPGLFSLDGSGAGQSAVLNFNSTTFAYTLNAANNPAHAGDTIVLYITGEGDYAQSTYTTRTGLLVPTPSTGNQLPQMAPLPTVTIGGAPATVSYAGPIIGSILGLTQLNVVIPAGVTTGPSVPVTVNVNGVDTQSGMTIAIHP